MRTIELLPGESMTFPDGTTIVALACREPEEPPDPTTHSGMRKTQALDLLGGSIASTAAAVGITYQAVKRWPENLPPRIADRVFAAIARKQYPHLLGDSKVAEPKAT